MAFLSSLFWPHWSLCLSGTSSSSPALPRPFYLQHLPPPPVARGLPEATSQSVSPIAEFSAQTTVPSLWHVLDDCPLIRWWGDKTCVWWGGTELPPLLLSGGQGRQTPAGVLHIDSKPHFRMRKPS